MAIFELTHRLSAKAPINYLSGPSCFFL